MIYTNINKTIFLLIFFGLFIRCKKDVKDDYVLTFSEEFNDSSLNKNVWEAANWGQTANSPNQQYFIDSAFKIFDGMLHIIAKRDTVMGTVYDANYNPIQKQFYYTSGLLNTSKSFAQQYGYFEIRSKVPYGKGFWPAFWLMPFGKWPPEIDIFEISGQHPEGLHMSNHFKDKAGRDAQNTITINGPDLSKDFHVFAVEWDPKIIKWYLDDQLVFQSESSIPQERMYIIVNLSLGGSFSGDADASTPLPNSFDIDYIRVYKRKN